MRIHRGILGAAISGAILLATAGAVLAAPAVATSNVNVRSGPGTGYAAVDVLMRGERVDVEGCERGWCYISTRNTDGWVSWQYLAESSRPTRPSTTFQFSFGTTPRYEQPRRPGPSHPGPSRPGQGRPWDDGPGRPGSGHNGPGWGNGGPGGNGPGRYDDPRGNWPTGPQPCSMNTPGWPFC